MLICLPVFLIAQPCDSLIVVIATESWGNEISWNIASDEGEVLASGEGYTNNSAFDIPICLEEGCYVFNMFDSFGDGWNGGLASIVSNDEVLGIGTILDGEFDQFAFGVNSEGCAPTVVFGCTDSEAQNFNPEATFEDGSCEYPCICTEEYAPVCVLDQQTGETLTFDNECEANCAGYFWIQYDGACEDLVFGCTDSAAENYDPNANADDGSCAFPPFCEEGITAQLYICTFSNGDEVGLDIVESDGSLVGSFTDLGNVAIMYQEICLDSSACYTAVMSNLAGNTGWYNGYFWINVDGQQVAGGNLADDEVQQSFEFSIDGSCGEVYGCMDSEALNYNENATFDDGSCEYYQEVLGCMDPNADNFNPFANVDDGSCFYAFYGCTDPIAGNYDPNATIDDGSCLVSACLNTFAPFAYCYENNDLYQVSFENEDGGPVMLYIIQGSIENNFDSFEVFDGGESGELIFSGDGDLSEMTFYATSGLLTIRLVSDGSVSCSSNNNLSQLVYVVSCESMTAMGCTDPEAENYDEDAIYDDGSCTYPCQGSEVMIAWDVTETTQGMQWILEDEDGVFVAYDYAWQPTSSDSTMCLENGCYRLTLSAFDGGDWNGSTLTFSTENDTQTYTLDDGGIAHYLVNVGVDVCDVSGCMDASALNYDPWATTDDESCEYPFSCEEGTAATLYICTFSNGDEVSLNLYDENGSTLYSFSELGNIAIMYEDICLPEGCISAEMLNVEGNNGWYNGYFWVEVNGQTIFTEALNDDLSSETATFSLSGDACPQGGCMDPEATNYNEQASFDDGSCVYPEPCDGTLYALYINQGSFLNEISFTIIHESGDSTAVFTGADALDEQSICLMDGCYTVEVYDSFGDGWNGNELVLYGPLNDFHLITLEEGEFGVYTFGVNTSDCGGEEILGCTDQEAINYNAMATTDDGSCLYEDTDCEGLNSVTIFLDTQQWGTEISWSLLDDAGNEVASGGDYNSYDSYVQVLCLADGCYTLEMEDAWGDGWNGGFYMIYGENGLFAEGSLLYGGQGMDIISINGDCDVAGCTDPDAINYSPIATIDDGNCVYQNPWSELNPSDFIGLDLSITIGPNPVVDEFTINVTGLKQDQPVQVKILNGMGQLMVNEEWSTFGDHVIKSLNASEWSAGTYFVNIQHEQETVTEMIIKQ